MVQVRFVPNLINFFCDGSMTGLHVERLRFGLHQLISINMMT